MGIEQINHRAMQPGDLTCESRPKDGINHAVAPGDLRPEYIDIGELLYWHGQAREPIEVEFCRPLISTDIPENVYLDSAASGVDLSGHHTTISTIIPQTAEDQEGFLWDADFLGEYRIGSMAGIFHEQFFGKAILVDSCLIHSAHLSNPADLHGVPFRNGPQGDPERHSDWRSMTETI
jgi:hypothetical protein